MADGTFGRVVEAENKYDGKLYAIKIIRAVERYVDSAKTDRPHVAVILDLFFSAPHLASGNPEQIAFSMYREPEEIRRPAELVKDWLKDPNEECLLNVLNQ